MPTAQVRYCAADNSDMAKSRTDRRGAPLWVFLTALVCVPLAAVVALTVVVAGARVEEADSAARAERAVASMALLDSARGAAEREVMWSLVLMVMDDPAALRDVGFEVAEVASYRPLTSSFRDGYRLKTDEALAALAGTSPVLARSVADDVAALRESGDSGSVGLQQLYLRYVSVSDQLMSAQRSAAGDAGAEGVPSATRRAIQDVQLMAEYAQAASRQLPLWLGSVVHDGPDELIGSRLAWETGWLHYTDLRQQLESLSQPSLRQSWAGFAASDSVRALDKVLDPTASRDRPRLTVVQLAALMTSSAAIDGQVVGLVDNGVDSALALAAADRSAANDRYTRSVGGGVVVLVAAALGALVLARVVSRSLGRLAAQAREVSEGTLVEVRSGGPREVRTVSAALGSAVDSLRRIQDQAEAVAKGDLANVVLAQPLPGPLGAVVHASVEQIVSSMRHREELQSALAHRSAHDPLTELPNRAQARALTAAALSRGDRTGEMTGLLVVDLDGFKAVNDRHGHACGDEVLREVARRMRALVRAGDVVARLGGDEFVVLVEPVDNEADLVDLAERLIAAIGEPITAHDRVVRMGASVGVAVSRDAGGDADVLLAEADAAAARAKTSGRGRAEVFDDQLRAQLAEHAELERAIADGLAHGEMSVVYQPVFDVAADRIAGYEALLRWQRPGVGMVPPDQFIPVAEATRLICDIDRWVLDEAVHQLAAWRATGSATAQQVTMAVNISGRHLTERRVISDVAEALAAAGVPADRLVVEVTETVLVDDPVAAEHLAGLRALGVTVAIDDFGTGYTSIGQLRTLPVDVLKIDRSFVAATDLGSEELVALMVRAAHTFGLTVVAEGVEEVEQLDRLRADACDHAQGYLLSRPLAAEQAGALLADLPVVAELGS
ncbi:EAL domain-containing protein [Modestobacter sp. I12A-02628]|uniref:Bifunctional diguanylate cyclase/phosphodiesterase n=1 Tax=Goekera deserti TaxID=2497753 RepID=A0A7K3WL45_9ACTN|nr:bifunctional diguanylate cyclase/phosphodiesterase [Goekera deserti]MPQ96680.1 EAL domain-containing protein [Goekera deserti]NDI47006.1 EAL domain-containing protein [Goekera deserti]NEL56243.1 bifunctional diguanylate cyclase/phosphodiesterase [Goekera deserti]